MNLIRLFNEAAGKQYLVSEIGIPEEIVSKLDLLGISSIANVLMAIKFAKYHELTRNDLVLTVFTDSMELYQSRLREAREQRGEYRIQHAVADFARLMAVKTDSMMELAYPDRRRIHNLKYYTWIEQQMFNVNELNRQWYDDQYWAEIQRSTLRIDELITEFNTKVGLL
jgi:cysteine synthase A